MPVRASTLCLIAFSSIMGMASVGLTSAHPHDVDIDDIVIEGIVIEGGEIEAAKIDNMGDSLSSGANVTYNGKNVEVKLSIPENIESDKDKPSARQLEDSINERLRANQRLDRSEHSKQGKEDKDRADRSDRNDRAERNERTDRNERRGRTERTERGERDDRRGRGGRRNRDGGAQDWPNFGDRDSGPDAGSDSSADNSSNTPSGTVTKLTIPTLTLDDLSTSFETRMKRHVLRFAESLGAARAKNEDRFAYFDEGLDIENLEDLRQAARLAEEVLAESGVISNAADFAADIIEDIKVERAGNSLSIDFEGKRVGKITRSQSGGTEHYNIEALGSLMTFNRSEIIGPDGKPRTRITVDIDDTGTIADE